MIDVTTIIRRAKRHAARVHEGEALVVVLDQRTLHRLNAVGTRVWQLCDGRSVAAIIDAIVAEFDVSREVASADVARFIAELEAAGAVEAVGAAE